MGIWETQTMEEAAASAQWEDMQMPEGITRKLEEAAVDIGIALDNLDSASEWLETTANDLQGLVQFDNVVSLRDDLENLIYSVYRMKRELEGN